MRRLQYLISLFAGAIFAYVMISLQSCSTVPRGTTAPDVIATFPEESRPVFVADSSLDYVQQVVKVANCVIKNEAFLKDVEAFPKYDFTTMTSKEVADTLRNFKAVTVSTYRTKNPWSAAIATTWANDPTVYLNTRKNPRPMPEMLNTAFHEGLHVNGFAHGDNYPNGKESSVNYKVGSIAEKYAEVCK